MSDSFEKLKAQKDAIVAKQEAAIRSDERRVMAEKVIGKLQDVIDALLPYYEATKSEGAYAKIDFCQRLIADIRKAVEG